MMASPIEAEKSQKWPQYLAVIITMLSVTITGLSYGWSSPAIPKLAQKDLGFDVTREQISYIVMLFPLSHSMAYPISALFIKKMRRKSAILLIAIPQTFGWMLIVAADNVYMLYASRICSGIASGLSLIWIPIYVCEVAEPELRGKLTVPYSASIILGSLLINVYGSCMPLRKSAYFSLPLPLLFQLLFIWVPESPYYHLQKRQTERARISLKRLRKMENVEKELNQLVEYVEMQTSDNIDCKQIFSVRSNRKVFFILVGIRTVQQFTGGTVFSYYIQFMFAKNNSNPIMGALIFNSILLITTLSTSLVIDRFGRRILLMISTIGNSLCLLTEGIYFTLEHYNYNVAPYAWLSSTVLCLFPITHGIGLSSVPTLLSGELFASNIKNTAVAISVIYYSFCVTAASQTFDLLDYNFGIHVVFFVYFTFGFFGLFFIYYYIPETRNRTLAEIQVLLAMGR